MRNILENLYNKTYVQICPLCNKLSYPYDEFLVIFKIDEMSTRLCFNCGKEFKNDGNWKCLTVELTKNKDGRIRHNIDIKYFKE